MHMTLHTIAVHKRNDVSVPALASHKGEKTLAERESYDLCTNSLFFVCTNSLFFVYTNILNSVRVGWLVPWVCSNSSFVSV